MFVLFWNLYLAMFKGSWYNFNLNTLTTETKSAISTLGTFLTSIFGDNQMTDLGTLIEPTQYTMNGLIALVSMVLALITSIGIVVVATKGVKKAFGIFFMGIRR